MRFSYLILLLVAGLAAGCNIVYKQDIQQGNILDKEDVEKLRTGMTKRQVLNLLGSPSIDDPFHHDRWDYVATYAPRGANMDRTRLTLRFEQDALASIEGDYLDSVNIAKRAKSSPARKPRFCPPSRHRRRNRNPPYPRPTRPRAVAAAEFVATVSPARAGHAGGAVPWG